MMNAILLLVCLLASNLYAKSSLAEKRLTTSGYFRSTAGKTYFIQKPGTLEPGVRVYFESAEVEKRVCKQKKSLPTECPIQEISFVPARGVASTNMTKVRLVEPNSSAWHRLRATEDIFGIDNKTQKSK